MELDYQHKQQLSKLLAQPWLVTSEHAEMLHTLTQKYPYYQQLYLLLAKAESNTPEAAKSLTKAAIYNNGTVLHRLINNPRSLKKFNEIEVVKYDSVETALPISTENQAEPNNTYQTHQEEPVTHQEKTAAYHETIVLAAEPDEQEVFEEINELIIPEATETPKADPVHHTEETPVIESLDSTNTDIPQEHYADFLEEPANEYAGINHTVSEEKTDTDNLKPESLANTDFFYFDRDFVSEKVDEDTETARDVEETTSALNITEPEKNNVDTEAKVSKYDDDKLPFTFLWWLAKTRKHYEAVFRPFVTQKTNTKNTGSELQQQYVEHIFHAQSPLEEDEHGAIISITTKESELIDNFIKNDPQIKPLKPDQINNENKAKKSAEDNYDLVSETLASIYIEQMLYHKAIDTYQKLSLKFPEKSRYFADLIQSLEKKI
ncbi:hypothetical protein [Pedobacter montanisoli]|uniref:Tetratricopeptide repeat protein n=1 Tax=Pedobacter montanisoli TaxID=2923277 RepID=A0ABS9ZU71_9SPHI|nr:hypothetical protein [Pedobacter montanisoli]MCJ0742150.1 hypothetical protein [Pedobacter montanisoli]